LKFIGTDAKFLELLKREIEIMQKIEHINIVRMYGAARTGRNLYMFLEYCEEGDLNNMLQRRENNRIT
jgi:serine/threonine-protein kinase ULK/ATG1